MNDEVKIFPEQKDFLKWLAKNFDKEKELWVGFYKKASGKKSIDWPQSVDAALCYGWIDGIRKSIDEISYKIRFTPRNANSSWSAVNIKRVEELTKLGMMQPAGLKKFNERNRKKDALYSYENRNREIDESLQKKFKLNKKAWKFFSSQAPSYQKTAFHWVQNAKKDETRKRRFEILVEDSENGRIIKPLSRNKKKKN